MLILILCTSQSQESVATYKQKSSFTHEFGSMVYLSPDGNDVALWDLMTTQEELSYPKKVWFSPCLYQAEAAWLAQTISGMRKMPMMCLHWNSWWAFVISYFCFDSNPSLWKQHRHPAIVLPAHLLLIFKIANIYWVLTMCWHCLKLITVIIAKSS